jgi:hypothetical protein
MCMWRSRVGIGTVWKGEALGLFSIMGGLFSIMGGLFSILTIYYQIPWVYFQIQRFIFKTTFSGWCLVPHRGSFSQSSIILSN